MNFKGENRTLAVVRKCIPAVLAALWAAPFIQHGSTKRAMSATNAVCAVSAVQSAGSALRDEPVAQSADAAAATATTADAQERVPPMEIKWLSD